MKKKENEKKDWMDVVFLLDRSGSMSGSEEDTIGGYNGYIQSHKRKNMRVTTVLFDDKYEMLHKQVPICEVKKMTKKEYFVRGCTALLDAIGKSIEYMDEKKAKKVLFMITTDGLENASWQFNKAQIKELIEGHPNYEFVYIGADIDSYAEARQIGIRDNNISNYKKDKKGTSLLYKALGKVSDMFLEEEELDYSWKEELEDYLDENLE